MALSAPEVRPVKSRADLRRFIKYPFEKYRDDPRWVPPLILDEIHTFNPRKNPFYQHARMEPFLAYRGGEPAGRVAAIDDDNHNETHGENLAFFGFFEAEDEEVARTLLSWVEEWADRLGREAVRGPANPSMNDGAGFQLDAFDTDPFIMMPHNPPEYPRYAEAAGYSKVKDLYAWLMERDQMVGERIKRVAERVRKRHDPVIRPANMKRFDEELATLKRLYNQAWVENWGFVRYTDAEFDYLAEEIKLIVDPDLVLFAELAGETAGVALCLPDANQVLKKLNGKILPFGVPTILRRRRIMDRIRLPILGVTEEHRGKGLEALLMYEVYRRGMEKGYKSGEFSWVLEDNHAINRAIEAAGAKLYKTYRIYQKEL